MQDNYTFTEHLDELRQRLFWVIGFLALFSILSYVFIEDIITIISTPSKGCIDQFYFFSPHEAFVAQVKLSFVFGLILSMPFIFYHTWMFIGPGLLGKEKKALVTLVAVTSPLFFMGVAFSYYLVLPIGIRFLIGFQQTQLLPFISFDKYVSFIAMMLLGFGFMFLMPVALYILSSLELIEVQSLKQKRMLVLLILLIIAAVITPPDAITQLILAIPMYILFEISLIFLSVREAKLKKKK